MRFVNAKINIGLQIVRRRPDGYHDLQTLFYPVGIYAGSAENPERFCDMVEVRLTPEPGVRFIQQGRRVDCPAEKNLVYRAAALYLERQGIKEGAEVTLYKNLPDGAGMGGGSADAAFTLLETDAMAREAGYPGASDQELAAMALSLGADCPFFLLNRPAYAEGVGERLKEIELPLDGCWIVAVKPRIYVSTREAFSGVTPKLPEFDLRNLPAIPLEEWRDCVHNDFEDSLFPLHPELERIKAELYRLGAAYASMTGSGSALYGIFTDRGKAAEARLLFSSQPTIEASYLLKA